MNVVVTGLGQHLDFESKEVVNVLTMRLPNGTDLQLQVNDEVAAQFVVAFTGEAPAAPEPPPRRQPQVAPEVFERTDSEEGEAYVMTPDIEIRMPPKDPKPQRTPKVRKSQLVGKDDAGNPIVRFIGDDIADIKDVLGTVGVKDEDGVSQL